MEFIAEFDFQFVLEFLLQILFELLGELGMRSLNDTLSKPRHPALSTIGFALWGAMAGGVSLFFFPHSPIGNPLIRQVNLVVTPVAAGLAMAALGRARAKRGQFLVRLDRFGYAFVFALAMAMVRFIWAS